MRLEKLVNSFWKLQIGGWLIYLVLMVGRRYAVKLKNKFA